MAAQTNNTQSIGFRTPFRNAPVQQPATKEHFYRYFQEEITGKTLVS
jgi:hypothetical protein